MTCDLKCVNRILYLSGKGWNLRKQKEFAMMNELNLKQKNFEIQQKQFIMVGGKFDQQKKLTPQEIKQLEQDYRTLYFGLVSLNWSRSMTLGMAWQKALEQIESFITGKTKNTNHPVNEHLVKIHNRFKQDQSKHIMECAGKESELKLNKNLVKFFETAGVEMVQKGKSAINKIYEKYKTEQNIQNKYKKFDIAKQKTQQIMQQFMLQQMVKQRVA